MEITLFDSELVATRVAIPGTWYPPFVDVPICNTRASTTDPTQPTYIKVRYRHLYAGAYVEDK